MATSTPVIIPLTPSFTADWLSNFADNQFQNITERTFRNFTLDIDNHFVAYDKLTTNMVRGATFRVPNIVLVTGVPTVDISQVAPRLRILGMEILAVNGTDASSAAAGVKAAPIMFQLVAYPIGPIDALVDEKPTTTATVKARLVRTSGTDEDKMAQFDLLELEDHDYLKGEVVKWVFHGGETRLIEWRDDSVGYTHPEPTGEDDDPIYAPFAPLSASTGEGVSQADFDAAIAQLQAVLTTKAGLYSPVFFAPSRSAVVSDYDTLGLTNVNWVLDKIKRAQLALTVVSGTNQLCTSYAEAESLTAAGGTIRLLGYHPQVSITRPNITLTGGVIGSLLVGLNSPVAMVGVVIKDTTVLNEIATCSSSMANQAYDIVYDTITTSDTTYWFQYSFNTPSGNAAVNQVRIRNTVLHGALPRLAFYNGSRGSGGLQWLERANEVASHYTLENCTFTSSTGPVLTGCVHPNSRLTLSGTTTLTPGAGQPLSEVYFLNGALVPVADFVVDVTGGKFPIPAGKFNSTDPAFATPYEAIAFLLAGRVAAPAAPAAPADLAVDGTRSATFTLAAGTTATDYEYDVIVL